MIFAATGHRPKSMGLSYSDDDTYRLSMFAIDQIEYLHPERIITGMALGWDQAVAWGCYVLGLPFTAAVPFPSQADVWPRKAREHYYYLLGRADTVFFVSDEIPKTPEEATEMLHARNYWMVDAGDGLLALWNGRPGGTGECVQYAESKGRLISNAWDAWLNFKA